MNVKLQILICTIGKGGIERVVESHHPEIEGVEYVVAWQQPKEEIPVPESLTRKDIKIFTHKSAGVSRNRNFALEKVTAPLAIMSDDDVSFCKEEVLSGIRYFETHPEIDLATMKFYSAWGEKQYSESESDLRKPYKGYYASCIEFIFRTSSVKGKVWFNERFGFGTEFLGGEDGLFLHDAIKAGLKCRYVPMYICRHDSESTGKRESRNPKIVISKGAQFCVYRPKTWLLRMLIHAYRERGNFGFVRYIKLWLQGRKEYLMGQNSNK